VSADTVNRPESFSLVIGASSSTRISHPQNNADPIKCSNLQYAGSFRLLFYPLQRTHNQPKV
jgi:hypothetical protein